MKKFILPAILLIAMIAGGFYVYDDITYDIREISTRIDLPNRCEVSTEKNGNIYLSAMLPDDAVIEVSCDNNSKLGNDLIDINDLPDSKMEILIKNVKESAEENGIKVLNHSVRTYNDQPFVTVWYNNTKTSERGIQHATICNFSLYTVTLKLHSDKYVTETHKKLINKAIKSLDIYDEPPLPDVLRNKEFKDWNTFMVEDAGIEISMPPEYIVVKDDVTDTISTLEQHGITKDDLLAYTDEKNLSLYAIPQSLEYGISIVTTQLEENMMPDGPYIENNFNKFARALEREYENNGIDVTDVSGFNISGIPFITFYIAEEQLIQNVTVHNSKLINVFFKLYDGTFTNEHKRKFDNIMCTTIFDKAADVESSVVSFIGYETLFMIFLPITIIMFIISLVAGFHKEKIKKHYKSIEQPEIPQ